MLYVKLVFAVVVLALIAVGIPHPANALTISIKAPSSATTDCFTRSTGGSFSTGTSGTCNTLGGIVVAATIGASDNVSTKTLTATGITIDNTSTVDRTVRITIRHTFPVTDTQTAVAGVQTTGGMLYTGNFKRNGTINTLASSSTTTLVVSGTCLPSGQIVTLPGGTKTVPLTAAVASTANRISIGNSQSPITCPNATTSMTLTATITATLKGANLANGDNITSSSTIAAALGDHGPVKAFVAGHFADAFLHPNDGFDFTNANGKVVVILSAEPDPVTVLASQDPVTDGNVTFTIPTPWRSVVEPATFFGGALMFGNAAKSNDDLKMQFEIKNIDTVYKVCGVESIPLRTVVDVCVFTCGTRRERGQVVEDCSTQTEACAPQEVSVDVAVDTSGNPGCTAP